MRKIPAPERAMRMSAADTIEEARPWATVLVKRAERYVGSKMTAYECVASSVGVSASWLRKFIGRQPGIALAAHEYLNIRDAYRSVCERVEAAAEQERQRYLALGRDTDAALESARLMVPMDGAAPLAGEGDP